MLSSREPEILPHRLLGAVCVWDGLEQAEAQLTQLKGLSAAKEKAEDSEKRVKAEAERAKAGERPSRETLLLFRS